MGTDRFRADTGRCGRKTEWTTTRMIPEVAKKPGVIAAQSGSPEDDIRAKAERKRLLDHMHQPNRA
jgi:hypothetical protein